jgi:hypothetical protein
VDADKPVSRQNELEIHEYYGLGPYWLPGGPHGVDAVTEESVEKKKKPSRGRKRINRHLRSVKEVNGYHIRAADGEIGHVEDFILDDDDWTVRYMVIDTQNWLPGKKVLISPAWVEEVKWPERKVRVDLSRELIKNSPEYDPDEPVNKRFEERLYDYYGRPKYWV